MRVITNIAITLLVIGGLNWGIIGVAKLNIIAWLFERIWLDRIIYCIVGLSAIWVALGWKFIVRPKTED